jgi:hypothetical protein
MCGLVVMVSLLFDRCIDVIVFANVFVQANTMLARWLVVDGMEVWAIDLRPTYILISEGEAWFQSEKRLCSSL